MSKALELSQLANDVTYNEATDTLSFGQANLTIGSDALLAYNDFSGDLTVDSAGVVTFATVNSNTGSFGSSTAIPVITVNAKGFCPKTARNQTHARQDLCACPASPARMQPPKAFP